jgi:1,3-beta-glucan synthase
MKQTKLRRRRVIRYAILYFVLLVVILALIIGPAVAGKYVPKSITDMDILKKNALIQPTGLSNDDTLGRTPTGTGAAGYSGVLASAMSASRAAAAGVKATATATGSSNKRMLLV